ncbi:MAG: adenylyltransferase/cytidyltransferase family protein [Patescibacteria group bacterium]
MADSDQPSAANALPVIDQEQPSAISTFTKKIVLDYDVLRQITQGYRAAAHRIVLTIGSWDQFHIGHARYLARAKERGDILVAGVDSDRAIKKYKGEHRPLIPEDERMEILCYLGFVDFVTLIDDVTERGAWKYGLVKKLKPHAFVAVQDSYPERQQRVIRRHCDELVVLPRQAENTSSSDLYRRLTRELPKVMELLDQRRTR